MTALTRFVLRHKALVVLFWLAVTAAGIMTVSATTHRMTNSFAMPGQAFRPTARSSRLYGNGGSQAPYVPVLTAPPGQRVDTGRRRGSGPGVRRRGAGACPAPGWPTTRAPATRRS